MRAVTIDLYADLVCPWCFIGSERLERVLASRRGDRDDGGGVTVRHRPFLLQPDTPAAGIDIPEMLARRYGADPVQIFARVEAEARASGLELDLTRQRRSYPTLRAHTLLRLAAAKGTQRALARALYRCNFVDARDLGDVEVLVTVAAAHGFTADEVRTALADPAALAATTAELTEAQRRGVRAVPLFVFDDRLTVAGAQPEAVLRAALAQAATA